MISDPVSIRPFSFGACLIWLQVFAALMASIWAVVYCLCVVLEKDIAAIFYKPGRIPSRSLLRAEPIHSINPFGDPLFSPLTPAPIPDWTQDLPHSSGVDEYHLYTGNGSIGAGWPHKADWMAYDEMYSLASPSSTRQERQPLRN